MIQSTAEYAPITAARNASTVLDNMAVYRRRREEHAAREEREKRARDKRYTRLPEPVNDLPKLVDETPPPKREPAPTPQPEPQPEPQPVQGSARASERVREALREYAKRNGPNRRHIAQAHLVYSVAIELSDWNTGVFFASLAETDDDTKTVPNMTGLTRKAATAGMKLLENLGIVVCTCKGGIAGAGIIKASAYEIAPEYRPYTCEEAARVPSGYTAPCTQRVHHSIHSNQIDVYGKAPTVRSSQHTLSFTEYAETRTSSWRDVSYMEPLMLYMSTYKRVMGKEHPKKDKKAWDKSIDKLRTHYENTEPVGGCPLFRDVYRDVIDAYFGTKFDDCDFALQHFVSGTVIYNRLRELRKRDKPATEKPKKYVRPKSW